MNERDERDEFDRIVEGLDLDLSDLPDLDASAQHGADASDPFPQPFDEPEPRLQPFDLPEREAELPPELRDDDEDDEVPFYRQVPPARVRPAQGTGLAWACVAAAPLLVLASAFFGFWVPSWLIAVLTVAAVSAVAWLFWHLPERGPSHRDWPDDGAEL